MSSSPPAVRDSSPAGAPGRRRSRFTYRHLSQLAVYSTACPLRVVAHVDLDAFYAQCEMVHLGVPEDQPLAVQQWQGLIAVNYAARKFGINRMCTVQEAKKLCPQIICQHVATWKEGEDKWAYHPDAAENIATHKVSLDPYRLASRKILALIKEHLPADQQRVEKAGIDEVFLDLSAQVHAILLERFAELARPPPYDDANEKLPCPSVSALDWQADALVDLDEGEAETDDPDWDDIAFLIGSEVVRGLRRVIRERLGYTCSAGIANNKVLSKLGSAYKKPNQQTVVRNRAIQHFMADVKFTKIRNLGGKLGDQVAHMFNTEAVKDLLAVPLDQLKAQLGDETGPWVYKTIRGIDTSEVSSRTQIKSMLSAKSFRPLIRSFEQGTKWLRIFVADIYARLVEEGMLENKRRPKSMTLHHRHSSQTHSRQTSIPGGRALTEDSLFTLAKSLLTQITQEANIWPCSNLSLSVGLEDGMAGNMGISAFLVRGDEAQALTASARANSAEPGDGPHAEKRRRLSNDGIQRFLVPKGTPLSTASADASEETAASVVQQQHADEPSEYHDTKQPHQRPITDYTCPRCDTTLDTPEDMQSHQDWHLAKDLQEQEDQERVKSAFAGRQQMAAARPTPPVRKGPHSSSSSKRTTGRRGKGDETGQSKLNFG